MKRLVDLDQLEDSLIEINKTLRPVMMRIRQRDMSEYNNIIRALEQGFVTMGGEDCSLDVLEEDGLVRSCAPADYQPLMTEAVVDDEVVSATDVVEKIKNERKVN